MEVRPHRAILACCCALVLLVTSCSAGGAAASGPAPECGPDAPSAPAEPTEVSLGVMPGAQDLLMFVMQREGFAEQRNLQLDIQRFQNPSALHAALADHAVDVGFGGLTAMAVARSQGRGLLVFNVLSAPSNVVIVPKESDAQTLRDVLDEQFGSFSPRSGTSFSILSVVAREVYGIDDLGSSVDLIEAPDAALMGLLDEGRVSAALLGSTASVRAMLTDRYRVITDMSADFEQQYGRLPGHVTVATNDGYAGENCAALRAFSGALSDSVEFIQSDDQVWQDYAQQIELDDPDAPQLLRERIGSRFIGEWDEEQANVERQLTQQIIDQGEQQSLSEVPDGLFRLDFREEAR